jgi:feruloyl-CoA synthase
VESAANAVNPDTVAKLLFTSGSTGVPKGVIDTNRMLCSVMQMVRGRYPMLAEEAPVLVDWLPWNQQPGRSDRLALRSSGCGRQQRRHRRQAWPGEIGIALHKKL